MSDNNQNILLNVLQTQGGLNGNSLIDILGAMHTEDEEPIIFENSVYLDNQALIDALRSKQNVFKVLSLNCQSLYAKFDQLIVYLNMIQEEDCYFDAICLQETWVSSSSDISTLYINGYELISKHFMCSSHGGLAIYLKECYQYKRLFTYEGNFTSWEQQFIEVLVNERTKSKLVIGNIYRLPRETNQDYDNFIDELSHILDNFEQNPHNVALFGDYNIDLLKIKERPKVNEFFELMMTNGFILKITLPTRFSRNNATLIDNVFCKISHNLSSTFSAISLSNISDHQPYILSFDYLNMYNKPTKLVKIQSYKDTDILNFKADLQSYDLNELINQDPNANPDDNYNALDKLLQHLKEKHFPVKKDNFNKYRHKKNMWITRGIMNSIKFRDKLYKKTEVNTC